MTIDNKPRWLTAFIPVFAWLLICSGPVNAAARTLDRIAAVVNDDIIMLNEVYSRARGLKASGQFPEASDAQLVKEALDSLVLLRLQEQAAKGMGLEVTDRIVDDTMQRLARQNNLSGEQFRVALAREGLEYNSFRESVRTRILLTELQKRKSRESKTINDEMLADFVTNHSRQLAQGAQYRYQHVLVPAPAGTSLPKLEQKKKQAIELRRQLLKGAAFSSLPNSSSESGAADSIPLSHLRVLVNMDNGQISEIFHDPWGFHIIRLDERKGGKQQTAVEEYHVRHILISTRDNSIPDAEARQKLQQARNQILAGADFAELAKAESDDEGSAIAGGDLGWSDLDQYVPQFAAAVKTTPVNQISEPFKSQFGWHIVQVLDKRQATDQNRIIREYAKNLQSQTPESGKAYENWLRELRNDAYIEYRINPQQ